MGELEDLCGRTVGDFVLRERIDEGGFGAVYRCEQPLLGREAVVKVLHQKLRRNDVVLQRFMREAQLASRLDHPYAAHVYAFGIEPEDGLFWIAMEMVQGTALNRWLRDRGPLTLHQLVPFFDRVAEVVQAAHERGIVHRDLKPSNVMVIERAGRLLPKLLDFGIAKMLDEAALPLPPAAAARSPHYEEPPPERWPDRGTNPSELATLTGGTEPPGPHANGHRLTHADATIGSPPYMSPEQWNNAGAVGPASDLYALGVVAYEALTGRRPFSASSIAEYVDMHCNYPVPPLGDGFPPAMDRLFQRALAKRPEDRWATALELATALRAASGLGASPSDLPRLDDAVRDRWIADAPQPLAESLAALDGARNAHQARDAAQELVRNLLRYLLAIGLATRAQVRDDRDDPALLELVRTLRRRDLDEDERVRLLRLLVRPLIARRGAHPVPELVDLVTPRAEDGTDGLDPILALHPTSDHAGSEDLVRERLARLLPELATLLRKLTFVLEYLVIVPRNAIAERWTGLRRQRRAQAGVTGGELVKHHPMLLDHEGKVCVDLWPLVQCVSPTEGADSELFLFDGRGRNGARMIAAPAGFEHHDPSVWEWIAARVIAEIDAYAERGGGDGPPYLGLTPFSTGDAGRYVGREGEVDAFINRLRQRPLQVVVGPSGAGKTSFVNAGVIPALPLGWRAVTLRPGAAPLTALAQRIVGASLGPADLRTLLEFSPAVATAAITAAAGRSTVVIVVDHLEELFTQCPRPDERLKFATALAELAGSDGPIRVVGAIRDDFLMELDSLTPLRALLSPGIVLLGNPSRDALVRIVVEPARRAGYSMSDPELAHDMVSVVADHPGALALLSFTSARLWELRDRRFRQLTRNAYDAMGGIGGALGRHAEDTFDQLSPEEQRLAREIFRHLVTADGTRALVTSKELRQRLATPRAEAVIDKLVTARLVAISDSSGEPHVEVIHDVLIDAWPRLQQWIREDVDDARMRDQLRIAARQWQDRSRSHALLWRGDVLADLERWLRRPAARALSDLEVAFIAASRRDARRAIRGRRGLGIVAAAFLSLFAVLQYRSLKRDVERQLVESSVTRMYIEQGRRALLDGKNMDALISLALAMYRGNESLDVKFMLERSAEAMEGETLRLISKSGRMWSAVISEDNSRIVTTDDRGAQIWDAATGERLFVLPHNDTTFDAAYSRDGQKILTASLDGTVKIWNAQNGKLLRTLSQASGQADYRRLSMPRNSDIVATIDTSRAIARVWNINTGALLAEIANENAGSSAVAISADGRWFACTGGNGVNVYDTSSWKQISTLAITSTRSLGFAPAGDQLVTGNALGDVSIWDVATGKRIRHLLEVGDAVEHVVVSPNGQFVAAATDEGTELVWQMATGQLATRLANHYRRIWSIEFDRSSQHIISAGADRRVVISDVESGVPISVLEGPGNAVMSAHFDATSTRVIAASLDGAARAWSFKPAYRRASSRELGGGCGVAVTLDEDGRFLAINCTRQSRAFIWDSAINRTIAEIPGSTPIDGDFNSALPALPSDGSQVAVARGEVVEVYSTATGALLRSVQHPAAVSALRFADGGTLLSGSTDGSVLSSVAGQDPVLLRKASSAVDAIGVTGEGRAIVASADSSLAIIDIHRRDMRGTMISPTRVRSIRVSRDGRRMITIPIIRAPAAPVLWSLENSTELAPLVGHSSQVYSARFVENGNGILTAGTDGSAKLWDGFTGKLRQTFAGSTTYLVDAAMSPDSTVVVTAGGDGLLRFWEAASGHPLWTLRAHKGIIGGVHFEGNDIVSRSFTGEVRRWHVAALTEPNALMRRVERLVRCLPPQYRDDTKKILGGELTCETSREPPL